MNCGNCATEVGAGTGYCVTCGAAVSAAHSGPKVVGVTAAAIVAGCLAAASCSSDSRSDDSLPGQQTRGQSRNAEPISGDADGDRDASPFPGLDGAVNDFADVLDEGNRLAMEGAIESLHRSTGHVVVVVTLRTCAPVTDMRLCSMQVFENHGKGIGEAGKDNGVLLLLSLEQRAVRITTGYGMEAVIPDALAEQIVQEMVPALSRQAYGEGLRHGVERLVQTIDAAQR